MKTDLLFPYPVPGADYDQEREILTPLKFGERLKWDCLLLLSQMFREGLSSSSAALGKESSEHRQQLWVRHTQVLQAGGGRWICFWC